MSEKVSVFGAWSRWLLVPISATGAAVFAYSCSLLPTLLREISINRHLPAEQMVAHWFAFFTAGLGFTFGGAFVAPKHKGLVLGALCAIAFVASGILLTLAALGTSFWPAAGEGFGLAVGAAVAAFSRTAQRDVLSLN
jgi:hypothetical protein